MDDSVLAAMAKWPNVPHCYGWLALNRRGQWVLDGDVIRHDGLNNFIGRNYTHDDAGNWFFQNGPQRVYVDLAYTPWIFHLDGSSQLFSHTGTAVASVESVWIDDEGSLILGTDLGIGLVDDRDLAEFLSKLDGATDLSFETADLINDCQKQLILTWDEIKIAVQNTSRAALGQVFSFIANPRPIHDT